MNGSFIIEAHPYTEAAFPRKNYKIVRSAKLKVWKYNKIQNGKKQPDFQFCTHLCGNIY